MANRTTSLVLSAALTLTAAGASSVALAVDVIIGTGREARAHHSIGRAICRQVRETTQGVTCEVLRIEGRHAAEPLAVLSDVRNGAVEMGIVRSDWQHHAFMGTGPVEFMDLRFDNLRALFSLYGEPFTLIARRDAGIDSVDDLAGKRVNIGNPGSDQRVIMEMVMKAKGWTAKSFQLTDELTEAEQSLALCHNRVQAVAAMAAHPNPAVSRTIELCDAKIVEVSGPEIDQLIAANGFLAAMEAPNGRYQGVDKAVKTFGLTVTAVSSADIAEDRVYSIVKAVFSQLDNFKRRHAAFDRLESAGMITDGLSAPLHAGAARYFDEAGIK